MLAYRVIDIQTDKGNVETKMSHILLERVLRAFKTHHYTADIDTKCISKVVGATNNLIILE